MDTRILEALIESAEYGNFSRAAARLGVAQSILSRQIATLEQELGGRLFERTGRGVVLSELGRTMLPHARVLLTGVRRLYDEAAAHRNVVCGTVTIGVVSAWMRRVVGPLMRAVTQRYPEVEIRVLEGHSGEIETWLKTGEVDIGLWNVYRETAKYETLSQQNMCLIAPGEDRSRSQVELEFHSLRGLDFVLQARPNTFRSFLDDLCLKAGFSLSVKLETNSYLAIREAVIAGGLYGLLPTHAVQREMEAGTLQAIRIVAPTLNQRTVLDTTSFRPLSLAGRSVYRVVLEITRGSSSEHDAPMVDESTRVP